MTATDDDLLRKLSALKRRAEDLAVHAKDYQDALLAARRAGASWPELAKAAGVGIGAVRSRHSAAQYGGELHIPIQGASVPQIPAPRRDD